MSEIPATETTTEVGHSPSEPSIEWQRYSETSAGVVIREQGVGKITGTLNDYGEVAPRALYVDIFEAEQEGQGSGKRLLRLLKDEGLKYRAASMSGHFTSGAALGAFLSVVGREHVSFSERISGEPRDITIEQALETPQAYIATGPIQEDPSNNL